MFWSIFYSCFWAVIPNMLKLFVYLSPFLFVCPWHWSQLQLYCKILSSRQPEEELAELTAQHKPTAAAAQWMKWLCLQYANTQSVLKWQRKQITRKLHVGLFPPILPLAVIILFLLMARTAVLNTISVFVSFSASRCLITPRTAPENWWTHCWDVISVSPIPYSGTCSLTFKCLWSMFLVFSQQ